MCLKRFQAWNNVSECEGGRVAHTVCTTSLDWTLKQLHHIYIISICDDQYFWIKWQAWRVDTWCCTFLRSTAHSWCWPASVTVISSECICLHLIVCDQTSLPVFMSVNKCEFLFSDESVSMCLSVKVWAALQMTSCGQSLTSCGRLGFWPLIGSPETDVNSSCEQCLSLRFKDVEK